MANPHGRARLRAFAAVPLHLDIGLLDEDELRGSRLLRICEWASHSGTWELRDHHNVAVGSVTGAVTLSCLGKALAPHLTQALGVQVNKSQQASSFKSRCRTRASSTKTKNSCIDQYTLYYKRSSASKDAMNPRRIVHRCRSSNSQRSIPVDTFKGELLFPRELPPPLFFKKGAKS
ncbi:uncharacterized protein PITG_03461 [Phytophthora infestans T30-4]|uniref:Uncharacterized protein n=1 Tax=Phytophthora infestans (strain T30-4) TaxID=403677 RepID=D0N0B7_PHYIT|nr:uncharacterized protein PITG_03461 [Phytophthora infestans T30-4]EEY65930.1 conserved hypothetical protein [Phytophthora infestans T30-4]|eukprot:XP_002906529.1 conserved hypothetical protein [Phytophthora infestans T30-4]